MIMTKTAAMLPIVLACATPWGLRSEQNSPDRYHQKLQPVLKKLIQKQQLPGFAMAVVEHDRFAYAAGFGLRNATRKDDPITTRSLFHMASITKTFVATSIMQLVERGKIDLDTPVVKYLPYFRMADRRYKIITVRQMVTHTSGMPDVEDYEWNKPQYDDRALERYVRSLGNLKLEFAPGERFEYSNMAFEILGDVIAKVSGELFDGLRAAPHPVTAWHEGQHIDGETGRPEVARLGARTGREGRPVPEQGISVQSHSFAQFQPTFQSAGYDAVGDCQHESRRVGWRQNPGSLDVRHDVEAGWRIQG
jgi:hypothetical protein